MVNDSHGHLVGIVTDRDLACKALQKPDSSSLSLSEVMTPRPLTVDRSADVELVIHLMEESGIRRIPVIETTNAHVKCIGLITLDDLVASKIIDYDHATRIVRSQVRRRALPSDQSAPEPKPTEPTQSPPTTNSTRRQHPPLNQFFRNIQESTDVQDQHLMPLTEAVLSAIVRRLHYTGAANFISRLPEGLQEHLLDLPPGPDISINAGRLVADLSQKYGYTEETMRRMLSRFFLSLEHLLGAEEIQHLRSELPEDLDQFFTQEPAAA